MKLLIQRIQSFDEVHGFNIEFEVFRMVTMKNTVFWDMMLCNQVEDQQCLRGILMNFYWTTWWQIPENGLLLLSLNIPHYFCGS
jgi:hypothetical protein